MIRMLDQVEPPWKDRNRMELLRDRPRKNVITSFPSTVSAAKVVSYLRNVLISVTSHHTISHAAYAALGGSSPAQVSLGRRGG